MGIFVDKCMALVDPETGKALTGEALIDAKTEKKWPRCGNKVPKAARFCNKCGSGATGGWWKCPSCKKWIGNASDFCPHCDQPLNNDFRSDIAGGVWSKQEGVFAQRFEIGDINRLLKKDLQVQAGTVGLLLDGGRFKGIIESGQYNPESLARIINHFGTPPPRSVILLDSGEIILPFSFENLLSADNYPLEFYGELIVRFDCNKKSGLAFVENCFKDLKEFQYNDLIERLVPEIRHAVGSMCVKSTTEDLVKDPDRRLVLHSEIESAAKAALAAMGFDLLRVSSAEFSGEAYDELAVLMGDVEAKRCHIEYEQKMQMVLDKDKMSGFKTEAELVDYQESVAHEYGIRLDQRDRDLVLLKKAWSHDDDVDDIKKEFELNTQSAKNDLELDALKYETQIAAKKQELELRGMDVGFKETELNINRVDRTDRQEDANAQADIDVLTAKAGAEARGATFGQEATEVDKALDWKERKKNIRIDESKAMADIRKGLSPMELLLTTEDSSQRKDVLEVIKMQGEAGMTPEQLLAKAAETSSVAAQALASIKDDAGRYKELLAEMKSLYKDNADRHDKNLETTLRPATEAAKRQDGNQTIVK